MNAKIYGKPQKERSYYVNERIIITSCVVNNHGCGIEDKIPFGLGTFEYALKTMKETWFTSQLTQ